MDGAPTPAHFSLAASAFKILCCGLRKYFHSVDYQQLQIDLDVAQLLANLKCQQLQFEVDVLKLLSQGRFSAIPS